MGVISVTERTGPRPYFVRGKYSAARDGHAFALDVIFTRALVINLSNTNNPDAVIRESVAKAIFGEGVIAIGEVKVAVALNLVTPL